MCYRMEQKSASFYLSNVQATDIFMSPQADELSPMSASKTRKPA